MTDVCRPVHHIRPAKGWLNDPNGLIHHDGRWHVFYQFRANQPRHGDIAWGHATSTDLFTWREEPVAIRPRPGHIDALGCWSGSCTIDAGTPTFCYTALGSTPELAVGAVARGDATLTSWQQETRAAAPRVGGPTAHTRDPYVFHVQGRRYLIQGHGGVGVDAQVLVYDATDLARWQLLGPLFTIHDHLARDTAAADVWECPNLLPVDGRWVLLVSLWRWDGTQGQLSGVRWFVGDLDVSGAWPRFVAETGGVLDDGPAFYAPQALVAEGRALLWGWSWELERDESWLDEHGWAGVLTAPRELHVVDGMLRVDLVDEVTSQAAVSLPGSWRADEHPCVLINTTGPAVLRCDDSDGHGEVRLEAGAMVLVDASVVEVFHSGATRTTRIYPSQESVWHLDGPGTVRAIN